jgi:hypothetical protein
VRLAVVVLAATTLAAIAGCARGGSSSAQLALLHPAAQVTLTCQSELPNVTVARAIAPIATDDKAISGQWAAS